MPGTRRLPSRDELQAWRDFIETTETLRTAIATRLQADTGLSTGDYAVLLTLSEAEGGRLGSSELAGQVGWERSRLSHHLGRMERRGLLTREKAATATDSRRVEIILAPAGATAFREATAPHLRAVRELFVDALTPDQIAAVAGIAAALRRHRLVTLE